MQFRKDIHGLRAIAVIGVIIFHLNPQFLPGGFIGVDIFFVISGYLMTGIIFRGLENNNFSLVDFYIRRAKRIIPALALLCLVLFIFAYLFIIPKDAKELGKHAFSSLLFYSNHVYLSEIDYFDELANQKWLLHTWSLSVEWQFYMLYPIALLLVSKVMGSQRAKLAVPLFVVIGFVLNIYISKTNPNASFYLLPARFWEMLLGGVAYLYPLPERYKNHTLLKIGQLIVITLLIISFFYIHDGLMWPGYYALVPTIGTYLIILLNVDSFALNNRFMQETGKYSYSLYLWHWPIIVAFLYLQIDLKYLLYTLLILLFSIGGYQLTEKKRLSGLATSLYIGLALFASISIYKAQGLAFRVSPEFRLDAKEYHRQYYGGRGYKAYEPIALGSHSKESTPKAIFMGDSYALQYAKFLDFYGKENQLLFQGVFSHGCLSTNKYTRYRQGKEYFPCSHIYNKIQHLLDENSSPLVLAFSWNSYAQNRLGLKGGDNVINFSDIEYFSLLDSELKTLFKEFGPRQYHLVGVPQRATEHAYTCLAGKQLIGQKFIKQECSDTTKQNPPEVNALLKNIAAQLPNVYYIDPNDVLCEDNRCMTIKNGKPIHSDYTHLSIYGAEIVGEYIIEQIK